MIRRYVLFAVALFILSGSLTATLATIVDRDFQLRGYVDPTRNQDLPFRIPRLGVNAELAQYTTSELKLQFERMQAANMTWVRQFARWDEIEPAPGDYDWHRWDQIVNTIDQYPDLKLVVVLVNSPDWSRDSEAVTSPPYDPADFGRFAYAFAQRYGETVDHYQIWDEPNLTAAWGNLDPRPAQYTALLQSAYKEIQVADPIATVMAAALAPTIEEGPKNISDIQYLDALYALEAHRFWDAVAAKPYGFDISPDNRTVDASTLNFSRIVALREIMVKNGDGGKPLWASNWGWNSLPSNWQGDLSIWAQVSSEQQVQYTLEALHRAEREWPWIGGMILQHWQPAAASDNAQWGFAVIDQFNTPTPLWDALTQYLPPSYATNGLYPAANPYTSYSGVWTFSDIGADIGWVNDSQFRFDFLGQDVALLLRQDDYVAYLYPTIDGQPANAMPTDVAGNAYIVLTSATRKPELNLVPVARDLRLQPHQLSVIADDLVPDEAQDRWALAGYAVSTGNLYTPYERQIAVSLITVIVAIFATVITGIQLPWQHLTRPLAAFWQRLNGAGQLVISAVTSFALMLGMLLTWGDSTPALFRREAVQLGLAFFTAGLVYIQPGLILTIVSLFLLFFIIYQRLEIGLALIIFWSPFFLFPVELFVYWFPMSELLVLLTTIAWILHRLSGWGRLRQTTTSAYRSLTLQLTSMDWAVTTWFAVSVLSLSWAELQSAALTEWRTLMLEPALFYVMLRTQARSKSANLLLVDSLLVAGFTVAIIGLMMLFQGDAIITAEAGARRLASVYGSPNNLGLFLGRCLPFALAFAIGPADRLRRIVAFGAFCIISVAIILSQSAGALFVGVPLALIGVLLFVWGRRALIPVSGLIVVSIAGLAVALRSPRFARLLDFNSGTNFVRLRVWHSALNMIQDHPITGLGLDQFLYAFRGAYISPDAWQEPDLSHPHNFILDFWIRLGLFGVLIFIWLQLAFWITFQRAYRMFRHDDTLYFALICGAGGSMVNVLGHGLVDNSVFVNDLAFVFVLLLALIANVANTRALDDSVEVTG